MGMLEYVRRGTKLRLLRGEHVNWIENRDRADYIRQVVLSAPLWVRAADFKHLRERVVWESEMHGVTYVLDHIVPLNHPLVCGLTVPWNLQPMPWLCNLAKGNDWNPDQLELALPDCGNGSSRTSRSRRTSRLAGSAGSATCAAIHTSTFGTQASIEL